MFGGHGFAIPQESTRSQPTSQPASGGRLPPPTHSSGCVKVPSMNYTNTRRPLLVRGHLVNRGVTITDLASRLGLTRTHVASVVSGRAPLTAEVARAIAQELGLGLEEAALLLGPPASWSPGRHPHP